MKAKILLLAVTMTVSGLCLQSAGCPSGFSEKESELAGNIRNYLNAGFPCTVTRIDAGLRAIRVCGRIEGDGPFSLCELMPFGEIGDAGAFRCRLGNGKKELVFDRTFDRYVVRDGVSYDRTLSRWVIVRTGDSENRPLSHARYADRIEPQQPTRPLSPASKKGLGDVHADSLMICDLDELGITSATVNIRITTFMYSRSGPGRVEHTYGGEKYYFDAGYVRALDESLKICRDRRIAVAAIILINNAASAVDPVIGPLLQHPDYTPEGNYSMPDMSTFRSVQTYAAALDFLAARYCRSDERYGRIHYWIMHNEVDSGLEWTNMGPGKPVEVYMDAYVKSMRLCHNIVRRYDTHAWVMASHTHAWAVADNPKTYASREMLEILNAYCRAEGDFKWGLAFHCYPHSLYEPKTWLDEKALYTEDTPIVTYKNLEVLDRWIRSPRNRYEEREKRPLWLSENGTNSPSYAEGDQCEQAAGFAWGWKKIAALDGIDTHVWHNWADHEQEYGLRIGLRKFPKDGRERKEVWHVYQAAGTPQEEAVFRKYLPVIGISDWNIIRDFPDSCNLSEIPRNAF